MQILRRSIGIFIAVLPFAIVIFLSSTPWRILGGSLKVFGYTLFVIGGLISCINFYLSFLRYPLHRLRGGSKENYRFESGISLFGFLQVAGLAHLPHSIGLTILAFIFLVIDTGSITWFIIAIWRDDSFWNGQAFKSDPED